jgi:RNA polymerase sigma-70 factor (ECF subfamily)
MGTCHRFKRNREDALALLNEGFLKVLLNLDKYDPKQDFFPWISTIMIRIAIDDYRKHRHYDEETDLKDTDAELEQVSLGNIHDEVLDQMSAEEVRSLLFELPENERIVFTLYELEGYQHKEIAAKLEVTERSTKRYLQKAKAMLKARLESTTNLKKVM